MEQDFLGAGGDSQGAGFAVVGWELARKPLMDRQTAGAGAKAQVFFCFDPA
jgi:hypothetical protein